MAAQLIGSNLRHADVRRARLNGAVLDGANLEDADLRGADLSLARWGGANLSRARLLQHQIRFIDPSAIIGFESICWSDYLDT